MVRPPFMKSPEGEQDRRYRLERENKEPEEL